MKIFTDASITYTKTNNIKNGGAVALFATHAVVAFTEDMKFLFKYSYTTYLENNQKNSIVLEEQSAILSALRKATQGSTIYTDSKQSIEKATDEMKALITEKEINLLWIPREQNIYADALCSKERNKILDTWKEEIADGEKPNLRKVKKLNKQFSLEFKKQFETVRHELYKTETKEVYKELFEKGLHYEFKGKKKKNAVKMFLNAVYDTKTEQTLYNIYKKYTKEDFHKSEKEFLNTAHNTTFYNTFCKEGLELFTLKLIMKLHSVEELKVFESTDEKKSLRKSA